MFQVFLIKMFCEISSTSNLLLKYNSRQHVRLIRAHSLLKLISIIYRSCLLSGCTCAYNFKSGVQRGLWIIGWLGMETFAKEPKQAKTFF